MKRVLNLALIVLAVAGCGNKKTKTETTEVAEVIPNVKVAEAVKQNVTQESTYSATVEAFATNNIAPQSSGRIQKINVEVGSFVSKGQILAEMDQVQLEQAGLQLTNTKTELDRLKQLYSEGGVSQSDYEAMELQYKVAKSTYDNLQENTLLRSPIYGVVTARNYDKGDMYVMGQPIFTVQQIVPVKILVGISEADYTRVKVGDKVTLTVDALPGESFDGKINRLYPTMDATTHTFNAEVLVQNSNRKIRPGMFARVTVTFGNQEAVVVPDAAIVKMQGSGQRSVYVVENGTAVEKVVTLGKHFDGQYALMSGLEGGEQVVIKGQNSLRNGIKVQVVE